MKTKIEIKELIETLDFMLDDHIYYLNKNTFGILDIDTYYYHMVEDGRYQDKIEQFRDVELEIIKEIIDFYRK